MGFNGAPGGRSRVLPASILRTLMTGLEKALDLGQAGRRFRAMYANYTNQPAQLERELRSEISILSKHGRYCLNSPSLIERQHQKLIAQQLLEARQREVPS